MRSQSDLGGFVGNKTIDGAVDPKESALVINLDHGKPALRFIRRSSDLTGGLFDRSDFLMFQLERRVDDHSVECTCVRL